MVVKCSANSTMLYDPATNSFSAGPNLSGTPGWGTHAIAIVSGPSAGKILVIHGNNSTTTSIYDPGTNTFTAGPVLPNAAGRGAHQFAITVGPHAGKSLVVLGNTTSLTAIFDPASPSFIAGPQIGAATRTPDTGAFSFVP